MRRTLALVLAVAGCSHTLDGPAPRPDTTRNPLQPARAPAQVCNAQGAADAGWPIDLLGDNFSPLVRDALTDAPGVILPDVSLSGPEAWALPTARVRFADRTRLVLSMPTRDTTAPKELAPGSYAVAVANPNGQRAEKAAALEVVPPPVITAVHLRDATSALVDPEVCADQAATLVVQGTGFRAAEPPAVSFAGAAGTLALLPTAVAVDSATQVTVTLAANTFTGAQASTTGVAWTVRTANPEGCVAPGPGASQAFGVSGIRVLTTCRRLGTLTVSPRFGWDQQNQPVTITNDFTAPATEGFSGGAPTLTLVAPLKSGGGSVRIPLRRAAFVDARTVTAVVPSCSGLGATGSPPCAAGIAAGGPYDLEVSDPGGAKGSLAAAFTVVGNKPPAVAALNPASITTTAGVTITVAGDAFDAAGQHSSALLGTPNPGGILFCPLATSGTPSNTSLTATVPAGFPATGCYVEAPSGVRTASATGFPLATGLYLVRVQHAGDVSSADYSGLIVTSPSFNPETKGPAASTLLAARGDAGTAVGRDDLGNAFLYVAGGSASGTDLLASVEAAPIGLFGDLGGDCTGASCRFRALDRTPLPTARSGLALVARHVPGDTSYLFALGGRGAPSGGGSVAALPEVLRAQVLRSADAPLLSPVADGGAGALAAGTWYYRVSGVRPATDAKNPGGETLASDEEPITLAASSRATLTWACNGADKYRVYRTAGPNQPSGSEVLLKEVTASCSGGSQSYSDNDATAPGPQRPLPAGALGAWASAAQGVPQLVAGRFRAAARLVGACAATAGASDCALAIVGGCGQAAGCGASGDLASLERATFPTQDTSPALETPGAFAVAGSLGQARSQHALAVVSAANANAIGGKIFLAVAGGAASGSELSGSATVEVALFAPTSTIAFTNGSGSPQNVGVGGWLEVAANQAFFGATRTNNHSLNPKSSSLCGSASCTLGGVGDLNFAFNSGFPPYLAGGTRYLAGEQLFRAYIYLAGGFASDTNLTPTATVERIVY